jgi:hypothetical protein
MEPFKVRSAPLFIAGGGKIGELKELTVSIKGNGERIVVEAGVIKTHGRATTDIDFETVVPLTGMRFDAFQAAIDQVSLTIMIPFNGKFYAVDGSFDEATFKSVVQSGQAMGTFKFTGGTPVKQVG